MTDVFVDDDGRADERVRLLVSDTDRWAVADERVVERERRPPLTADVRVRSVGCVARTYGALDPLRAYGFYARVAARRLAGLQPLCPLRTERTLA